MNNSTAPHPRPSTRTLNRRARTLRGKFGSLEKRYLQGRLDEGQEEAFERLCLDMHHLYKDLRA